MSSQTRSPLQLSLIALLFLIAPIITFAIKGTPIVLACIGFIALLTVRSWRIFPKLKDYWAGYGFLALALFSLTWSIDAPAGSEALAKLTITLACLFLGSRALSHVDQNTNETWKNILSLSFIAAMWVNAIIAPWPYYGPVIDTYFLSTYGQTVADAVGYEFELIRQVNRALALLPVIIFIIAPFELERRPRLFCVSFLVFFLACIFSDSQTAVLALLLGLIGLGLGKISAPLGRGLVLACLGVGLIVTPFIIDAITARDGLSKNMPTTVNELANADARLAIYRFFARDVFDAPLIGHGFYSAKDYSPPNIDTYLEEMVDEGLSEEVLGNMSNHGVIASHPHQLFLQILFELGFVGAAVFWLASAQLISNAARSFEHDIQPWIVATLGPVFAQTLFGYSPWQSWLLAALGLCLLLACIFWQRPPR